MTIKAAGPCRLQPDATPKRVFDGNYANTTALHRQPAVCELHCVNLVHRFPPRCPLSTANPLQTLGRIQDAAWRVIGRGFHDPELPDALALLDAKDVCMGCLDRILTHPTVRRCRANETKLVDATCASRNEA